VRFGKRATLKRAVAGDQGFGGQPTVTYVDVPVSGRMCAARGAETSGDFEAPVRVLTWMTAPGEAYTADDRLEVDGVTYQVVGVTPIYNGRRVHHQNVRLSRTGN